MDFGRHARVFDRANINKAKVLALSMELAPEEQARLEAAGTLVELEELAREIGDELVALTAIAIGLN